MPPHRYVLKMRVARAAQLLRSEPQRALADVALAVGFASQAHFSSAFKAHVGKTPAAWRSGGDS
jgi:AraC family transcriptional regulator